jgi:predicted  nucleic acid-binding Zn-ribbon protein
VQVKAEEDARRLTSKLEGIRDSVDEKSKELSMALKSFADMQRNTAEREQELRSAAPVPHLRMTNP